MAPYPLKFSHGDVFMEWWCLAIIIADKEILQNIADISHGGAPMVLCPLKCAHGGVLMEWWCLAIIIADKEILQNIADISHSGVSMAPCSWLYAHGGVRPWLYAH